MANLRIRRRPADEAAGRTRGRETASARNPDSESDSGHGGASERKDRPGAAVSLRKTCGRVAVRRSPVARSAGSGCPEAHILQGFQWPTKKCHDLPKKPLAASGVSS